MTKKKTDFLIWLAWKDYPVVEGTIYADTSKIPEQELNKLYKDFLKIWYPKEVRKLQAKK